MQPASSKHGPVSDEALAKEARGSIQSSQGSRIDEGRAEDLRSDIASALRRTLFPANRATLLDHADSGHTRDEIRDLLSKLPAHRTFRNVEEVWEQVGEKPDAERF